VHGTAGPLARRFQQGSDRIDHRDQQDWQNSFNGKTGSEQPQPATAEDLANTRPYPHNMVIGMPLPKRTLRAGYVSSLKGLKMPEFPE